MMALALVGYNVVNGLRTDRIFMKQDFVARQREPFLFWMTVVGNSLFCLVALAMLIGLASGFIARS